MLIDYIADCAGSLDGMWNSPDISKQIFFGLCGKAASILISSPKTVVALIGIVTFYGFASLIFFRFYFSLFLACLTCKAKYELKQNEKARQNGTDQRGVMQVCNTECVHICLCIYCMVRTRSGTRIWYSLISPSNSFFQDLDMCVNL